MFDFLCFSYLYFCNHFKYPYFFCFILDDFLKRIHMNSTTFQPKLHGPVFFFFISFPRSAVHFSSFFVVLSSALWMLLSVASLLFSFFLFGEIILFHNFIEIMEDCRNSSPMSLDNFYCDLLCIFYAKILFMFHLFLWMWLSNYQNVVESFRVSNFLSFNFFFCPWGNSSRSCQHSGVCGY